MRWAIPAAIVEFEAAMILGSENMEMHFDLADAYYETDQIAEALATVERAIVTAPDEAWVQESAGWFYQGLEHHEEAIRQFERALELDPGAEWVFEGMAISYEALGNFDKADEIRGMIGSGEQGMDPYA
jgi:tetratricopeptide (TPR) repeat protein